LIEALEKRHQARKKRDWAEADKQRELIQSAGFIIEDGPSGSRLKKQ
jgi:cysteinyl-tRNA synthetase